MFFHVAHLSPTLIHRFFVNSDKSASPINSQASEKHSISISNNLDQFRYFIVIVIKYITNIIHFVTKKSPKSNKSNNSGINFLFTITRIIHNCYLKYVLG